MRSRRPSVTKRSSRPPEDVVFFVDRCLGSKDVPEALLKAGARVEKHADHFPDDSPDQHWLQEVGRRGWAVITKDRAIRRNTLESQALATAGVRAFVVTSANMSSGDMTEMLSKHLKRMENLVRSRRPPFIAAVTKGGVQIIERPGSEP